MNHLHLTHSSDDENWSRSYIWSIANRVTVKLSLCRHLLPSDFISASGGIVQPFNSSFNSLWCLHPVFQEGDGLDICSECVRAPLSHILSRPYLCHLCRCHWGARETMSPCMLLAFLWWLAVLHVMAYTYEHRAISLWGITVQMLRSSKNQFIMVLLWRCSISYKYWIIFTRWYMLRIFSPIL